MVTWEGRWGSQAVKRYQRGVELYNVGAVSGVVLVLDKNIGDAETGQ